MIVTHSLPSRKFSVTPLSSVALMREPSCSSILAVRVMVRPPITSDGRSSRTGIWTGACTAGTRARRPESRTRAPSHGTSASALALPLLRGDAMPNLLRKTPKSGQALLLNGVSVALDETAREVSEGRVLAHPGPARELEQRGL